MILKICRRGLHNYELVHGSKIGCPECYKVRRKEAAFKNKEYHKNYRIEYKRKNPDKIKGYYLADTQKVKDKSTLWRKANPDKKRACNAAWLRDNLGKCRGYTAKRRSMKRRATPAWTNQFHRDQMDIFYDAADALTKELGIKMEVDHIIPLKGTNSAGEHIVCGLHVPWNLQILTRFDNRSKGSKFVTC